MRMRRAEMQSVMMARSFKTVEVVKGRVRLVENAGWGWGGLVCVRALCCSI